MAVTVKQAMNRILGTIAEDEVGSSVTELSEDYHLLILTFLNQIKEEIEDSHDWRALRQTVTVSVTGGTAEATITEANERSRVVRIHNEHAGQLVPLVFDFTDSNNPTRLDELDLSELIYRQSIDPNQTASDEPSFFAIDNTAGDVMKLRVWPTPDSTRSIRCTMVIPQAWFEATDVADTISIPVRPLVMGTVWYALMERGEEQGINGLFSEERFRKALDDAIGLDAAGQGDYQLVPV